MLVTNQHVLAQVWYTLGTNYVNVVHPFCESRSPLRKTFISNKRNTKIYHIFEHIFKATFQIFFRIVICPLATVSKAGADQGFHKRGNKCMKANFPPTSVKCTKPP